MHYILGTPL